MRSDPHSSIDQRRLSTAWNRIARKTRRFPLFSGTPRAVMHGETLGLTHSRLRFVYAFLAIAAGGAGFAVARRPSLWPLIPPLSPPLFFPHDLVAAVSLGFLAISVLVLARANRIECGGNTFPGQIQIVHGTFPFLTCVRANLDELSVRLSIADDKSSLPTGVVVLSLHHDDPEARAINVAAVEPRRDLRAVYSCLAQRMKAKDETVVRLALPDGGEIVVPKTPLGFMSYSIASYRLAFSDPCHAAFLPTTSWRRWPLHPFLGALAASAMLAAFAKGVQEPVPVVLTVLFAMSLLVMLVTQAISVSRYEVTFDRAYLSVRERNLLACLNRSERCPIACIAAVQICSRAVSDEGFIAYELNVVFRDQAGARLPIISHGDSAALRADAAQLARFLRVPLLDHARTSAAT